MQDFAKDTLKAVNHRSFAKASLGQSSRLRIHDCVNGYSHDALQTNLTTEIHNLATATPKAVNHPSFAEASLGQSSRPRIHRCAKMQKRHLQPAQPTAEMAQKNTTR